jgi:uncharacterized surface protein with fasciclin (FAS1) repeats
MKKTLTLAVSVLCLLSLVLVACSDDKDSKSDETTTTTEKKKSIVDVASGNDDFSTLVSLVKDANLDSLLQADGTYTVFAPTNDAFAKVPAETLAAIKANPDALKAVLTYHAVSTEVLMSSDFTDGQVIETASGYTLTVNVKDGNVTLTTDAGATVNVVKADVGASNGVIHAIDGVLVPKAAADLLAK